MKDELGLAPSLHNLLRRLRGLLLRGSQDPRPLDPLVVDDASWREMRRNVRSWPDYREVPNAFSLRVSQADWDEYWGVDTHRKAMDVARYLLRQAADKGLWIAGTPQVSIEVGDEVARGDVRVSSSFAAARAEAHPVGAGDLPDEGTSVVPAASLVEGGPGAEEPAARPGHAVEPGARVSADETVVVPRGTFDQARRERSPQAPQAQVPTPWEGPADRTAPMTRPLGAPAQGEARTQRLRHAIPAARPDETVVLRRAEPAEPPAAAGLADGAADADDTADLTAELPTVAYLTDGKAFRMPVHPGDVIGAVLEGREVPADVNVRLGGSGFPGVEPRHLSFGASAIGWTVTDLAEAGTRIERASGEGLVLGQGEVAELHEGDVIYLGPERPLTFES